MACCPLHNHSEYSAIDGLSRVTEMRDRALEIGAPYMGLTDHGVVAGHLELDKVFRKANLKPIFGCELYHGVRVGEKLGRDRDQAHLIALAMTDEGLRNLWRLNDVAAQEPRFHHVGRNIWDDFEKYKEGIVFTSACDLSLVSKGLLNDDLNALNRYLEIFGDNFYIELSTYPADALFFDKDSDNPISPRDLNEYKVAIARERGIPVVYGDDGHYAFPWQFEAHDAYVAKATGQTIYTPIDERKMYHPEGALCIKSEDEVRDALWYLPDDVVEEAIDNAIAIGERADAHLPEVRRHLPIFNPNESPWVEKGKYADDDADMLFIDEVEKGMVECYGEDPDDKVINQTQYEAQVFLDPPGDDPEAVPLFHYFLMDWDMIQFCKNPSYIFNDVEDRPIEVGPGRGSSAGCIVARELGITDIDPLPYDLYFERFWNPGRAKGFPDIDTDIEKGRRNEVKRYLTERYGHNRVRSIGNIGRFKPKAVVKELGRAVGLTEEEQIELKKIVEDTPDLEILGPDQIGWDEEFDPGKVIYVMHPTPDYPDNDIGDRILEWVSQQPVKRQEKIAHALDLLGTLTNRVHNYGVHASGIVVSDVDLADELPCRFAGSPDQRIPVTQFAMDDVEKRMFVKLDALGLRTLDVLADWKKQMLENHGIDVNWSQLEWTDIDPGVWEVLHRELAAGIFQVERGRPKELCGLMKPTSVEGLSIIGAAIRPGPERTGATDSIVTRMNGDEDDLFDGRKIPILAPILEPTHGWFLYQEQVIAYFNALGYELSDSDAVRKILGKKQPEKWDALYKGLDEWEGKSYVEMTQRAGMDPEQAEEIWAMLKEFAKYSFNKSHTIAYGTVGFRTAYAKFTGPPEFYKACIANVNQQKKAEHMPRFINEARRLGINVNGVDIEYSKAMVNVTGGEIYFGFDDVKGVSTEGAFYLVDIRDNNGAPIETPEALDEYLNNLSKVRSKENAKRKKEGLSKLEGKSPKQKLHGGHIETLYTAGAWERLEGYPTPIREMQQRELETLQVILSDNSAEAFAENSDAIDECDSWADLLSPYPGEDVRYTVPGVVTVVSEMRAKTGKNIGKKMAHVTIEFEGNECTFVVFTNKWRSHRHLWHERTPGIFTIKQTLYKDKPSYNFETGNKL